jgi:hypothetical protein
VREECENGNGIPGMIGKNKKAADLLGGAKVRRLVENVNLFRSNWV